MIPKRIQRSRAKGWRKPEGSVIVDRTSRWGNPFIAPDPAVAVAAYRRWLTSWESFWRAGQSDGLALALDPRNRRAELPGQLPSLAGKDLVCWCPLDRPCHADVLLELANAAAGDPA